LNTIHRGTFKGKKFIRKLIIKKDIYLGRVHAFAFIYYDTTHRDTIIYKEKVHI